MAQVQLKEVFTDMSSCRVILQQLLCSKQQKNGRYSLRAFARDLKISPSFLSEVLNGKYGISRTLAKQIADRLHFDDSESSHFCSLADLEINDSRSRRRSGPARLSKSGRFQELEINASEDEIELKFDDLRNNIRDLIRQAKTGTFMLHIRS